MKKRKIKKTKRNIKNILQFIQDSFSDFLMIVLWVLLWNLIEPFLSKLYIGYKILIITTIIFFLNKSLLKFPSKPKKYKKQKLTLKDIAEKIENLNSRV